MIKLKSLSWFDSPAEFQSFSDTFYKDMEKYMVDNNFYGCSDDDYPEISELVEQFASKLINDAPNFGDQYFLMLNSDSEMGWSPTLLAPM